MDADERLNAADLDEPSLLAAQHLHRYEIAAAYSAGASVLDLGCGVGYGAGLLARAGARSVVGVDVDAGAVEAATARYGSPSVRFVHDDATAFLHKVASDDVDLVVCYEAVEHVEDPEALIDGLASLVAEGVGAIVSVPNSRTFGERNPFHRTDFDADSAHALFARLGDDVTIAGQVLGEGSLLVLPGDPRGRTEIAFADAIEHEYSNTFVAFAGLDPATARAAIGRLNAVAVANHSRYMLGLTQANRALRAANTTLSSGYLGRSDAGAASVIENLRMKLRRRESEIDALQAHIAACDDRIHDLIDVAEQNHATLERERRWRDTRRYVVADRLHENLLKLPGVERLRKDPQNG